MDNLASVFQYCNSAKDISDVLNTIDLVVACGIIRNSVVESAIPKFPQLKDHKVPQRTVIYTKCMNDSSRSYYSRLEHCLKQRKITSFWNEIKRQRRIYSDFRRIRRVL